VAVPFRWIIAGILLFLQLALGVNWMAVTPLFPLLMDELAVDRATVSLLFGLVALAQAASALPAGMLVARAGARWTVLLGALVMAAGLATPFLAGYPPLLATRILFGLGTGFMAPAAAAVAVQWLRPGELVIYNGLGIVAMNTGMSLGLFLPVPLTMALGWRGALAACGARRHPGGAAPPRDVVAGGGLRRADCLL
jgi:MFS family permease